MIHPRVATGTLVRDELRHILLIRRGPDAVNGAGEWSVPGGKLDPGETLANGAGRELFEETGVVAEGVVPTGIHTEDMDWGPDLHFVTHFYQATPWGGHARIMEPTKHDGLLWLPDDELALRVTRPTADFTIFAPTRRFVLAGGLARLI